MTQTILSPEVRPGYRVQRLWLRRRRRIALAALIGLALTVGVAGKAFAWHSNVTGSADCDGSTVTVTVPDESWVEDDTTASGEVTLGGQSKPWSVQGAGSATVAFPGVNGGTAVVTGTFNTGEDAGGSVTTPSVVDCEQTPPEEEVPPVDEEPPAEETPPVEEPGQPKDEEPQIGPPDKNRKRAEPNPDDSIPVGKPAPVKVEQPSQKLEALPFTGPREDMQRAMGLGGLVLLAAGAVMVRAARRKAAER
jgi:hypothetical protein